MLGFGKIDFFRRLPISPDEYLTTRVDDQISWYDRRSRSNQSWFKRLRVTEIVGATSIPFVTGFITTDSAICLKIVAGGIGVVVAVMASLLGLFQLQENWIEYRTTCESLKKEKYLFLTKSEPYNGEDAFPVLVQRIETLVSKENTNWAQYMMKPNKGDKNGG